MKKLVGYKAVDDYVKSNMVVGLGTGSTAFFAVERLGQKLRAGELSGILGVPTSARTQAQAEGLGIPLATLDALQPRGSGQGKGGFLIDVAIDGADDVDGDLNLVKGGGGALLREKMVEVCAETFVVVVDESKIGKGLGPGFPIPVEVTPFCHGHTLRTIAELPSLAAQSCKPVLRLGSAANNKADGTAPAVTDNGNYIVDLHFEGGGGGGGGGGGALDVAAAAAELKATVGVVEHGLFIGMASAVLVAGKGGVSVLQKKK